MWKPDLKLRRKSSQCFFSNTWCLCLRFCINLVAFILCMKDILQSLQVIVLIFFGVNCITGLIWFGYWKRSRFLLRFRAPTIHKDPNETAMPSTTMVEGNYIVLFSQWILSLRNHCSVTGIHFQNEYGDLVAKVWHVWVSRRRGRGPRYKEFLLSPNISRGVSHNHTFSWVTWSCFQQIVWIQNYSQNCVCVHSTFLGKLYDTLKLLSSNFGLAYACGNFSFFDYDTCRNQMEFSQPQRCHEKFSKLEVNYENIMRNMKHTAVKCTKWLWILENVYFLSWQK